MSQDLQARLTLPTSLAAGTQFGTQTPFDLGNDAFDLPALAVAPPGEVSFHLATVASVADGARGVPGVDGEDGQTDAQFFPAQDVKRLGIVGRVAEKRVQAQAACALPDHLGEVGGVVAGATSERQAEDQVGAMLAHERELQPRALPLAASLLSAEEIPAHIARFQARRIHRAGGARGNRRSS